MPTACGQHALTSTCWCRSVTPETWASCPRTGASFVGLSVACPSSLRTARRRPTYKKADGGHTHRPTPTPARWPACPPTALPRVAHCPGDQRVWPAGRDAKAAARPRPPCAWLDNAASTPRLAAPGPPASFRATPHRPFKKGTSGSCGVFGHSNKRNNIKAQLTNRFLPPLRLLQRSSSC